MPEAPIAIDPAIPALIIIVDSFITPAIYAPITTPSIVRAPSKAFITKYLRVIAPTPEISLYFFH